MLTSEYLLNPIKNDPQGFGSALTYARRYSLSALVGIVTEEDDDGVAASKEEAPAKTEKAPQASSNGDAVISVAQGKRLYAIWKKAGWEDEDFKNLLLTQFNIGSTRDILRSHYEEIVELAKNGN